ncbi:hypothetical protein K438DRAFT_2103588 [Mycena galopus ATCC 62051]|nr:hypothetical protein K438DRAFT_2103588 [Mycena galopus ATCC 62051]
MSELPTVFEDRRENFQTNCVGFAAFTVLIWDHVDTFTMEVCILADGSVYFIFNRSSQVEYIWKRKKGPLVYLFLLNRYLTPLGFIVNLYVGIMMLIRLAVVDEAGLFHAFTFLPISNDVACTMIFQPELIGISSSSAWMPLVYDSYEFIELPQIREFVLPSPGICKVERGDLSAIFAVNVALTIMIISAPGGLKNIAAQYDFPQATTFTS